MLGNTWISSRKGQTYLAITISIILYLLLRNTVYFFALPFIMGAGLWFLYEGFSNPSFFMILFIVIAVFRLPELFPQKNSLPLVLIVAFLGFLSLLGNALLKRNELFWSQNMAYFIAFFLWVSICMVVSYDFSNAFDAWSGAFLKVSVGFFLIAWAVQSKKDYFWCILACIVSGVFISIVVFYNKYNSLGLIEGTRATIANKKSLIGDPNDLALMLLVPFSFSLVVFSTRALPNISRFLSFISLLIVTYCIVLTQSRGGALGVLVITICFLYQNIKSRSLVMLLGVLVVLLLYIMAGIGERQPGLALDESANYRIEAWKSAIKMALDHPLFGVGINSFDGFFYLYRSSALKMDIVAHSIWFSVLAENGFIGILLFISCIYHAFKTTLTSLRLLNNFNERKNDLRIHLVLAKGLLYGLIGFCVAGTFLNQAYGFVFYTLFALAISLEHSLLKLKQG